MTTCLGSTISRDSKRRDLREVTSHQSCVVPGGCPLPTVGLPDGTQGHYLQWSSSLLLYTCAIFFSLILRLTSTEAVSIYDQGLYSSAPSHPPVRSKTSRKLDTNQSRRKQTVPEQRCPRPEESCRVSGGRKHHGNYTTGA